MDNEWVKMHKKYWCEMRKKSAESLARICEEEQAPETEADVKRYLENILDHGDNRKISSAVEEVAEWATANLELGMLDQSNDNKACCQKQ